MLIKKLFVQRPKEPHGAMLSLPYRICGSSEGEENIKKKKRKLKDHRESAQVLGQLNISELNSTKLTKIISRN
jgi:hypothetical protein